MVYFLRESRDAAFERISARVRHALAEAIAGDGGTNFGELDSAWLLHLIAEEEEDHLAEAGYGDLFRPGDGK